MTNDLCRLGTCGRLSRHCRRTIFVKVSVGLAFTFGLIVLSDAGVLGIGAPTIAALLHKVSTFIGIAMPGVCCRSMRRWSPRARRHREAQAASLPTRAKKAWRLDQRLVCSRTERTNTAG
jgi:hypothetical protein